MSLAAFQLELGSIEVRSDEDTLTRFAVDESDSGTFPPQLVAFPRDANEVQTILRAATAHRVPVTPVGARTGKSGGSLPVHGGVAMSLERLNRITAVRPDDLSMTAEPGVILKDIYAAADAVGLMYPPDPNSWESCTLGGNIAENAGGPCALKYGVTRDYVLALDWVLPTGELIHVGRNTSKGVAGYDLVSLFVGSEGTLGVATSVTLKLIPKPKHVKTALLLFTDLDGATKAISQVLREGVLPRTLELLDDVALDAVKGQGVPFPPGTGAAVIAEVDGNHGDALFEELTSIAAICERHGAVQTLVAQDEAQRERLWAVRRNVSRSLRALAPKKISEDIVVPRSQVPEAVRQFKDVGRKLGLVVATYGHAGDGNLHTNVLYAPEQRHLVDEALADIMRITVRLGGTITGEHGVGVAKKAFLGLEQSPRVMGLQQQLKVVFDPASIMNPGKIFPGT